MTEKNSRDFTPFAVIKLLSIGAILNPESTTDTVQYMYSTAHLLCTGRKSQRMYCWDLFRTDVDNCCTGTSSTVPVKCLVVNACPVLPGNSPFCVNVPSGWDCSEQGQFKIL